MELVFVRTAAGVPRDDALERAVAYLSGRGYVVREAVEGQCFLTRGWHPSSLLAMRMDRLPSRVRLLAVDLQGGTQLTIRYEVDTFGHYISATNRRFWDLEVDDLCDQAQGRPPAPQRWAEYGAEARSDTRRFLLRSFGVAVAGFLAVYFIGLWLTSKGGSP